MYSMGVVSDALVEYAKKQLLAGYTAPEIVEAILDSPDYGIDEAYAAVEEAQARLGSPPSRAPAVPAPSAPAPAAASLSEPAPALGALLALAGGIVILINGMIALASRNIFADIGLAGGLDLIGLGDVLAAHWPLLSLLSAVFGIVVLMSAIFLRKKKVAPKAGGLLILILSAASFILGVGVLVGPLIALIGGLLILMKK